MRRLVSCFLVSVLTVGGGATCSSGSDAERTDSTESGTRSVWTVDLVNTLPGRQAEYVRSIETNWASARRIAAARGVVLSYRALVAPPDTARGWDVMLMTEYTDSATWESREEIFQEIFESPEFVRVPTTAPSSELRTFAVGGLPMREFVSER